MHEDGAFVDAFTLRAYEDEMTADLWVFGMTTDKHPDHVEGKWIAVDEFLGVEFNIYHGARRKVLNQDLTWL